MAPRKQASARRVSYESGPRQVVPFTGQNTFRAFPVEFLQSKNHAENVERFEELLEAVQGVERLKPIEKPKWDPPEIEDRITDLDLARDVLEQTHEPRGEVKDWDEARVWREMYLREYEVSDKLRQIAQNLDDKFDEAEIDVDDHNNVLDGLSDSARRLQLDLNL